MGKRKVITEDKLLKRVPPNGVLEMIGRVYDRLTVTAYAGYYIQPSGNDAHYVWCRCSCGKIVLGNTTHIRYGNWVSCGCKRNELSLKRNLKHGYAPLHGKRDKIYVTWQGIHKRCNANANDEDARKYIERGIKVCEGWSGDSGFEHFKKDMLPITGKSIDRIENNLHYSCGHCDECKRNGWEANCRWADDIIQSNNRSNFNNWITIDGVKMTYRQADRHLGFKPKTLQSRIKTLGWSEEKAISTPIPNHLKL